MSEVVSYIEASNLLVCSETGQNHFIMKTSHVNSALSVFTEAFPLSGVSPFKGGGFIPEG